MNYWTSPDFPEVGVKPNQAIRLGQRAPNNFWLNLPQKFKYEVKITVKISHLNKYFSFRTLSILLSYVACYYAFAHTTHNFLGSQDGTTNFLSGRGTLIRISDGSQAFVHPSLLLDKHTELRALSIKIPAFPQKISKIPQNSIKIPAFKLSPGWIAMSLNFCWSRRK